MSEKRANYTTRRFYDPLDDLLDRPIAFNPAFKKITGSTVAALMLSQAWYWMKRTSDEGGWFYKTIAEWEDETGLTRSEQETARKHLKDILEVELRGVPATLYYRVNREKVLELLGVQFAETLQTSLPESRKQDCGNPANINRTEITSETTHGADAPKPSMPIEWQIVGGVEQIVKPDEEQARRADFANLLAMGMTNADTARAIALAFQEARGITLPTSKVKGQRKAVKEMIEMGVQPEHVRAATRQLTEKGMTVSDLFSIVKTAIDLANAPKPQERTIPTLERDL